MATLQEFKCPRCGGALNFDPNAQTVKCPYCDTEFEMAALMAYDAGMENITEDDNVDVAPQGQWSDGETDGMYVYVCKSCGGEIIGDATLGATKCPYCDNPVVLKEMFSGDLRPDYVIPFKLDKEAAKAKLKEHVNSRKLVPAAFRDQSHIDEIKGVYVPVWLYDTDARGSFTYRGERSRSWVAGDFEYTQTDYFALVRGGYISFDNLPVDASQKMDDTVMQSLEPFDFSEAVDFQTAYLAGYLADRYDEDAESRLAVADERIKNSVRDAFYGTTAGYAMVTSDRGSVGLENLKAKYALYPVWLLSTNWEGENYLFAMNGQTGKFVGDLPVDKNASTKLFLKTAIGVAVAALAAVFLSFWM